MDCNGHCGSWDSPRGTQRKHTHYRTSRDDGEPRDRPCRGYLGAHQLHAPHHDSCTRQRPACRYVRAQESLYRRARRLHHWVTFLRARRRCHPTHRIPRTPGDRRCNHHRQRRHHRRRCLPEARARQSDGHPLNDHGSNFCGRTDNRWFPDTHRLAAEFLPEHSAGSCRGGLCLLPAPRGREIHRDRVVRYPGHDAVCRRVPHADGLRQRGIPFRPLFAPDAPLSRSRPGVSRCFHPARDEHAPPADRPLALLDQGIQTTVR